MLRIILISCMIFLVTNTTVQAEKANNLIQLSSFFEEENIYITEWQVLIKEKKNRGEMRSLLKRLENSYKVTRTKNENIIKYQIRVVPESDDFSMEYTIVWPNNKVDYPEISLVFHGHEWNQQIKENYLYYFEELFAKNFTKSSMIFSWLKTESSDIIINGLSEKLTNYFKLQQKMTQQDETSSSVTNQFIYGYTPMIDQKIVIENAPVNMQLAITSNGKGMTEMTLGTPILIHEY